MKVYIAGKITGFDGFKEKFAQAEKYLIANGHSVMNPAVLGAGFTHEEYMKVCYSMIDVCDMVHFLDNWQDSKGAKMEHEYAVENNKRLSFDF